MHRVVRTIKHCKSMVRPSDAWLPGTPSKAGSARMYLDSTACSRGSLKWPPTDPGIHDSDCRRSPRAFASCQGYPSSRCQRHPSSLPFELREPPLYQHMDWAREGPQASANSKRRKQEAEVLPRLCLFLWHYSVGLALKGLEQPYCSLCDCEDTLLKLNDLDHTN